jgi:AraC-like DNA-binding protein
MPGSEGFRRIVVAACASAILLFTHVALWQRRRMSVGAAVRPDPLSDDELRLAAALRQLVEGQGAYREPELKVADLARRLQVPEQRVSRAVGQGLGERNFNQWVNRCRVQEACRLLLAHPSRSVLEISGDCGFASLGPFNRAFKAATGTTPSAWRTAQRTAQSSAIHVPDPASA